MRFLIQQLVINCKTDRDVILFTDFNYFYGQIGAGKSTIARLLDFCLGGELEYTPALQQEFVSATLELAVAGKSLALTRNSEDDQIRAQWTEHEQPYDVLLPAEVSDGEVLPGTSIETVSDLVFHLAGVQPPRVHRSKSGDNLSPVKLTFRDFFAFCYLDEDSMNNSFFDLNSTRSKSRDVVRAIIGWHSERVAELQIELEQAHKERVRCEAGARAIKDALEVENMWSPREIAVLRQTIQNQIGDLDKKLAGVRAKTSAFRTHQSEVLQAKGRKLAIQISQIDDALYAIEETITKDRSHRNTLLSLGTKQKRAQSALAILSGVEFEDCPKCHRDLSVREAGHCIVCGQSSDEAAQNPMDEMRIDADVKARTDELEERMKLHATEANRLKRERQTLAGQKAGIDEELSRVLKDYDSAYLAGALEIEKEHARLSQRLLDLRDMETLANKVERQEKEAARLKGVEAEKRTQLNAIKTEAERDQQKLDLLKKLFLNCLLKSRLSGFLEDDIVDIEAPDFFPKVYGRNTGDMVYTSFKNLGSSGKKAFFKCCFAVAMHRLAACTGVLLPPVLVIDSPMSNVSERENRDQFAGFHKMLYQLADGELKGTQFIIIDKEIFSPEGERSFRFRERHMKPDDPENPPLIRHYRGK